ncbi:acyl esterase [Moraxella osloensis]|uniref:acyl esterase n=1 Tax=Faucicola osloensis TaxID=34062 RepID=UPI002005373E|nr:acyl esterase [Moraxella osloensis]MCK6052953.1 acyl esterase [Moraxella osloensis]
MKKIVINNTEKKKIDIFTLVTNYNEYSEMVNSAETKGFFGENINFCYFDNIKKNDFDAFKAINIALNQSQADYIIFCHQDILFNFDDYTKFKTIMNELEMLDPLWGVAGNAGKNFNGEMKIRITDPHGKDQKIGLFPEQVISLDENFLIMNNKYNLSCSYNLNGYHLYGLDICANAMNLGLNCYVVDFHLTHKSGGKIDSSFLNARKEVIRSYSRRLGVKFFSTTCTEFFVTPYITLSKVLNNKYFYKVYKILVRNFI